MCFLISSVWQDIWRIVFASGFKTDPVLTFIRGPTWRRDYLKDLNHGLKPGPRHQAVQGDPQFPWPKMGRACGQDIESKHSPVGFFEGSNAWAVRTGAHSFGPVPFFPAIPIFAPFPVLRSGMKPIWSFPGANMYGPFFLPVFPWPLLGYNQEVAWSLTMFPE